MKYLTAVLFIFPLLYGCGDNVVTTQTGLKYSDHKSGTGRSAQKGDLVTFHFTVWNITDSTDLFEDWSKDSSRVPHMIGSSKERNEPVKIMLGAGQFIKGSDEGIIGMKPGGARTIIIPSELAYGKTGAGPVPADTDLKVYVELIDAKVIPAVKQWEYDSTKVQTTPSGLKYIILREGTGELPDSNDMVSVHYSGFLLNGFKFDSSVERDEPFTFTIGRRMVIPGWEEGISLLRKGSKAKLIIPAELGYGQRVAGQIPPNSTLVFDVEVMDIKKN